MQQQGGKQQSTSGDSNNVSKPQQWWLQHWHSTASYGHNHDSKQKYLNATTGINRSNSSGSLGGHNIAVTATMIATAK